MKVSIVQWLVSLLVTQKTRVRFPIETFTFCGRDNNFFLGLPEREREKDQYTVSNHDP